MKIPLIFPSQYRENSSLSGGLMMGTWFFSTAAGNYLAGLIASGVAKKGAGPDNMIEAYSIIGWSGVAVGFVVLILSPFIKKLMHMDTFEG